jgi:hypothetical protein
MSRNYIDFISAYCDSWCERCPLTERCSHFAVQSAEAMCDGDFEAALELALGPARVPGGAPEKSIPERMAEVFENFEPSEKELDEMGREMEERRRRIERYPLAEAAIDYTIASLRWLDERDRYAGIDDASVREAVEVIGWDSHLIHVKIMRALNGRDEGAALNWFESAIQNDWNGSAKVALISIERSERAWRTIAQALGDETPTVLADTLRRMGEQLTKEFPRAKDFCRPGFDESR